MKKTIIILALVPLLFSCKLRKVASYKEYVHDTMIVKDTFMRDRIISKEFHDTSYVDSPCDSAGILKAFSQTIKADGVMVNVFNDHGKIKTIVKKDADTTSRQEQVHEKIVSHVEYKEIVKNKVPKWCWYLLGINMLIIIFIVGRWYLASKGRFLTRGL